MSLFLDHCVSSLLSIAWETKASAIPWKDWNEIGKRGQTCLEDLKENNKGVTHAWSIRIAT